MARAEIPEDILPALKLGRMTAFRKSNGGVRGIVAGDALRRLIARTMAQQISEVVQTATAPFQYALSTRAGCECVTHVVQAITDLDARATVLSIDGVSAYDFISRRAMVTELARVPGGSELVLFVLMFYGSASQYLWEDDTGDVFRIEQGEGGEQGDPLMPLLFALGQHRSLTAVQNRLRESEKILAFLDDVYVITTPDRVGHAYTVLQHELWTGCHIRINTGKTQVWNRAGERPAFCNTLERIAHESDQRARVWRGSGIPTVEQGLKLLGTRSAILSTCPNIWRDSPPNTRPSLTGFPWSLICSVHGRFFCTVHQPGRISSSGWSDRSRV